MCGVFRGQACVFEAQKRVFERARALDQATGSMLRTHARVLQVNDCVFFVCSWCVPADHIGAFQVNTFFVM